jgi:hypothetical protein
VPWAGLNCYRAELLQLREKWIFQLAAASNWEWIAGRLTRLGRSQPGRTPNRRAVGCWRVTKATTPRSADRGDMYVQQTTLRRSKTSVLPWVGWVAEGRPEVVDAVGPRRARGDTGILYAISGPAMVARR